MEITKACGEHIKNLLPLLSVWNRKIIYFKVLESNVT